MPRLAKYTESILVIDSTGTLVPAEGASVNIYAPDTTTNRTIYSDSSGAIQITPPIVLGSDGLLEFYVRSQDRTFDINVAAGTAPDPQFTTFTIQDESAHHDDAKLYVSEYASFQAAIDAATAGTTIVIDDDVTVSAVLTVIKSDLVIEGENRGISVTLTTNANCDVFDLQGTRVTLRNFTIDGNASNQSGAGPFYGLDFSGTSTDFLVEDLYVTNVKGDGIRCNGLLDSTVRRVRSAGNNGHGFSSDSSYSGSRVSFQDCVANQNGTSTATFTRQNGYHFEPPMPDLMFTACQARSNLREGFAFIGISAVTTINRLLLNGCYAVSNGGVTYDGLLIQLNGSNGTSLSELQIAGGHFSDNGRDGIHLEASDTTNPGNGPRILNFVIDAVTSARNGRHGININGRCAFGQISSPIVYEPCQLSAGYGINLVGATTSNALDDASDVMRCRHVHVTHPVVNQIAGGAAMLYGISAGIGTKHCVISQAVITGGSVGNTLDEGMQNIVYQSKTINSAGNGLGGGGGMPAWPMQTNSSYGSNSRGGFWIVGRTRTISSSETRVASQRITANTRVLALVPMDVSASSWLMSAGGGWYHKLSANVSGTATGAGGSTANMGYLTLYTIGTGVGTYGTGEFAVFCAEAQT